MRFILSICGLLLVISMFSAKAQANIDVACVDGDCLSYGWDIYDTYKNDSVSVVCVNSSCATDGWLGVFKEIEHEQTICKGASCFRYGWSVYDVITHRLKVDVTCRFDSFGVSDCLRSGWDIRDYQNNIVQSAYCLSGDCRYTGWDVYTLGYPIIPVRCKLGGCFQAGWISYR